MEARTGALIGIIIMTLLLPAQAYSSNVKLITSVNMQTNPDGSVFSGVPFRFVVTTVSGCRYTVTVRPIGNLSYTYIYDERRQELTIVGEEGEYEVVVNASLGGLRDVWKGVVRVVPFSPSFQVILLNTRKPFLNSLTFEVIYNGTHDWVLPATFRVNIYDVFSGYRVVLSPTEYVFTLRSPNVTVRAYFSGRFVGGVVRVGFVVRCFYFTRTWWFDVPSYYLLEEPADVQMNAPMRLKIVCGNATYTDEGQTLTFPPAYCNAVKITFTTLNGKVVYSKVIDGEKYGEFLEWVHRARVPRLYLKLRNDTDTAGCYRYVVGGHVYRIADLSPIGIPNSTTAFIPAPNSTLYCVGAVSVVHVGGAYRQSFNPGLPLVLVLVFGSLSVAYFVLRGRRRKVVIEKVEEGGASGSEVGGGEGIEKVVEEVLGVLEEEKGEEGSSEEGA